MIEGKIEPIILLLAALAIFFTVSLVCVEKWFQSDGQIFQVIAGSLTGVVGALLIRVKPPSANKGDDQNAVK